jgi:hypothetical protein
LVQAYYLAPGSADGALRQVRLHDPASRYWKADGQGDWALTRADTLKAMVEGENEQARDRIGRQFYHAAAGCCFPCWTIPFTIRA